MVPVTNKVVWLSSTAKVPMPKTIPQVIYSMVAREARGSSSKIFLTSQKMSNAVNPTDNALGNLTAKAFSPKTAIVAAVI